MTQTNAPMPLAGPLRSRINQLAHQQALHFEIGLKATMLKQLQDARDAGATYAEQAALVASMEAAPP